MPLVTSDSDALSPKVTKAHQALHGKIYELSIVRNYVSHWGLVEAVRELIQNALDSDSPFRYEFLKEDGFTSLRLNSEFSRLSPQSLLLGATSKADSQDTIGSFGEGYKIALLVLLRNGYHVVIENGDLLWEPFFRESRIFEEEVLAIAERIAETKTNRGLTFTVKGLTDNDIEVITASCLKMQREIGQVVKTEVGDILLERPGKLYVGSLYICDTDLKFGYNFKPHLVRLERDRRTIHSWDLKSLTLQAWYSTKDSKQIAKLISENVPDVEYAQYDAPELVKEECYRIFREKNPNSFVARNPEEAAKMVKDGLIQTVYVGSTFSNVVHSSHSYRNETQTRLVVLIKPEESLRQFLQRWRNNMPSAAIAEFNTLISYAERNWMRKP